MPQVQILRAFVQQRLTAAAEEIFELFERTIAEYEETLSRQGKLLDAVFKPQVRLHRAEGQLVLVTKEEVPPEQQEWRPSLDQDVPPELPHIKKEQEERWTRQQGEQLPGLEETGITKFTFTPVPVKREEAAEEKPQPPRLHHAEEMKTETDGQDCGGPEPHSEFNPDRHLQPDTDDEINSSEPETDGSCDWEETSGRQSGLSPKFNTAITPVRSSECASSFGHEGRQQEHSGIQTRGKIFNCPVCGKEYPLKKSLSTHMRLHSAGKSFSCPFCQKTFPFRAHFVMHMRVHTGEKPFSCSVCDTKFTVKANLRRHMRTHTGEKPFTCNVCVKSFTKLDTLKQHKCAGESSGSKRSGRDARGADYFLKKTKP